MIALGGVLAVGLAVTVPGDRVRELESAAADLYQEFGVAANVVVGETSGDESRVVWARIGPIDGPVIVVLPAALDAPDPAREAFGEPLLGPCRAICEDGPLRAELADVAVLVPLLLPEWSAARSEGVDPAANFPARWDEARARFGSAAGPYPGAVPRVSALADGLLGEGRCAAVVVVGAEDERWLPGSLGAFCVERLGVSAFTATKAQGDLLAATRSAFSSLPRLALGAARWQRLGPKNWALDVELMNRGGTATAGERHVALRRAHGIDLAAHVRTPGVAWTASAVASPRRSALIVAPRGRNALRLVDLAPNRGLRVRLFFTGAEGAADAAPVVDLTATSARSPAERLRRLSP